MSISFFLALVSGIFYFFKALFLKDVLVFVSRLLSTLLVGFFKRSVEPYKSETNSSVLCIIEGLFCLLAGLRSLIMFFSDLTGVIDFMMPSLVTASVYGSSSISNLDWPRLVLDLLPPPYRSLVTDYVPDLVKPGVAIPFFIIIKSI